MKITMLGCGSSAGVPFIACDCPVCTSKDPKNQRMRVSLLIEANGKSILIDSSPDLRHQALAFNIRRIDAVVYTHDHADHVNGIDDLRSFNYLSKEAIPVFGDEKTLKSIESRFPYAFLEKPDNLWYRPCLVPHPFEDKAVGNFSVMGVDFSYFELGHGKVKSFGYRIGNFVYSTDCDVIPEAAFEVISGVDTWIVDCLRYSPSYSHADLNMTLGWVKRAKPRRAILTHMNHDFDYDTLKAELPAGVEPGYDGLVIEL